MGISPCDLLTQSFDVAEPLGHGLPPHVALLSDSGHREARPATLRHEWDRQVGRDVRPVEASVAKHGLEAGV